MLALPGMFVEGLRFRSLDASCGFATLKGVVPPDEVVLRVAVEGSVAGVDVAALVWLVLPLACDAERWTLPSSSAGSFGVDVGCGAVLKAFCET